MKRFGKGPAARIGAAAFLSALHVLVRHHPGVAVEMAGAGLKRAGATGLNEVKAHLPPWRGDEQ
jgi:hypothetical protein